MVLLIPISVAWSQVPAEYEKRQLIVKFKQTAPVEFETNKSIVYCGIPALDELNAFHHCKSVAGLFQGPPSAALQNSFILTFENEENVSALAEEYSATGLFEYAQANYIGHRDGEQETCLTPNEPAAKFKLQWGLYNDGSFTYANGKTPKAGADINIKPGWDITTGDVNTIVAIIDGGINLNHSEFSGRIWTNTAEVAGNNLDDDGNGFKDDVNGWNFNMNNNNVADAGGHGTNVASIIGATGNNSTGWAGINWKCKLMIVSNYSSSSSGFSSTVICNAIKYAADNGAKVINMSLGFTGVTTDAAMQSAIDYAYGKNVLLVTTMGNNNSGSAQTPACLNHVMAVGATNVDDSRCVPFGSGGAGSQGSNFGNYISVVAPGNWIVGCVASGTDNYSIGNSYNGTSQAAPHVTGLASLIYVVNPNLTPAQVKNIIETTAKDQVGIPVEDIAGWDKYMGWGRIDAYQALLTAQTTIGVKNKTDYSARLQLYPNPFNERVYFLFDDASANTMHSIVIYDVMGKMVKQISERKNRIEVGREGMEEGIYLYTIISENGQVQNGKLIVGQR